MPYNFSSPTISASNIKMKWKEQYTSAALNKKFWGVIPKGIYRGFVMTTHGSNNTISLDSDPDRGDHLAVAEDSNGYSLTYRHATSSYTLALTDASLYSQTLVIVLALDYSLGVDTTGTFRAYTDAEWDALSTSAKEELIVIGTVINPASGNTIPEANLLSTHRTDASFSQSVLSWQPVITNSRFLRTAADALITGSTADGWISSGDFWGSTSDVEFADRCLEYKIATSGTKTASFYQRLGCTVYAGKRVAVRFSKKVISAASSGTARVTLTWASSPDDGDYGSSTSIAFPIDATDSEYVTTTTVVNVPANVGHLMWAGIEFVSAVYATNGPKVRFGQLQVLVEPADTYEQGNAMDSRLRVLHASGLIIEEEDGLYEYGGLGAALRFDAQSPNTTEGSLALQRKDSGAGATPAFNLPGRILNLGNSLIGSQSDALKPRVSAPVATVANAGFTLLWESVPTALKGTRLYVGDLESVTLAQSAFLLTVNASFNGTNWVKDVNGAEAIAFYVGTGTTAFRFLTQAAGTNTWTSGNWLATGALTSAAAMTLTNIVGGEELSTLTLGRIDMESIPKLAHNIVLDLGYERRGNVLSIGDGDVAGMGLIDPHGAWVYDTCYIEEDFAESPSLGIFVKEDISGTGSITSLNYSAATVTTGTANGNHTIIKHSGGIIFESDFVMGIRARVRASDITAAEQRFGLWSSAIDPPDQDAAIGLAFKIINGVVSLVHSGGAVVSTGVTVAANEFRWYTASFNSVNGLIQWHISAAGASLQNGYNGGSYGEVVGTAYAGDPAVLFFGVKTTTASAASGTVDYIAGWMPRP